VKLEARRIVVTGRVQGVGFRPFVYVTAQELGITGTVYNGSGKVFIHAEGSAESLDRLEHALVNTAPPLARPKLASSEQITALAVETFEIIASEAAAESEIHVPPDLYTCDECVAELTGRQERRFGYPFINCTQCGPRYTIITAMPYDRPNTSMADFPLCDDCRAEYESPTDRRFHAQPLACEACGPQLEFSVGASLARETESQGREQDSLLQAIQALKEGRIVAIKGVGGYHLVCDAANNDAVTRLRERKHRPHKPLAVMFPISGKDDLGAMRSCLQLDETTATAIKDPARPIVLARKKSGDTHLSASLAPGLSELGVFLPYSPLHHQLLQAFGKPVVATSGNISGEPVITDNEESRQRLKNVADAFLHHNRPIVRPADDPVIRPMAGKARVIRLGRGIAPLELELPSRLSQPVLATGGHMKVTVALAWDSRIVISPHIGELDSPRSNDIFNIIIKDIQRLYDVETQVIACDLHPDYPSSRWAEQQGLALRRIQHHAAHASALAGEHPDIDKWLVFTWDGVGYGSDGTLWGGEALTGAPGGWHRAASFRPFSLVGGDKASREPWRSAAALMWAEHKDWQPGTVAASHACKISKAQANLAHQAWHQGISTHETSAVGRLFDAAAALVLGRNIASFEGQGPMELEHMAIDGCEAVTLPLKLDPTDIYRSDWSPLLEVLSDGRIPPEHRAGIFHETMAQALVDQAVQIQGRYDYQAIGLSGGVFQNRRLSERVVCKLEKQGIEVRLHEQVPANDGGLCFGQVIESLNT
jgi:hydrogenase maturation protein HypF